MNLIKSEDAERINKDNKKPTLKYNKRILIYDSNNGFLKYCGTKKLFAVDFFNHLVKSTRLKTQKEKRK